MVDVIFIIVKIIQNSTTAVNSNVLRDLGHQRIPILAPPKVLEANAPETKRGKIGKYVFTRTYLVKTPYFTLH